MNNTLTVGEIRRRGMAAIEEGLRRGPVHIMKRNRPSAVILSEAEYQRLTARKPVAARGLTAVQWLLAQHTTGKLGKREIDKRLAADRAW